MLLFFVDLYYVIYEQRNYNNSCTDGFRRVSTYDGGI
jgi:hypothetical protein